MGDFNAKLGCEAQVWGGAIGALGLSAPTADNATRLQLLHLCMANNLVADGHHLPAQASALAGVVQGPMQVTAPSTRSIMFCSGDLTSKLLRIPESSEALTLSQITGSWFASCV